jgi:hypothetical protein
MTRFPCPYLQGEVELTRSENTILPSAIRTCSLGTESVWPRRSLIPIKYVVAHGSAMPGSLHVGANLFVEANM